MLTIKKGLETIGNGHGGTLEGGAEQDESLQKTIAAGKKMLSDIVGSMSGNRLNSEALEATLVLYTTESEFKGIRIVFRGMQRSGLQQISSAYPGMSSILTTKPDYFIWFERGQDKKWTLNFSQIRDQREDEDWS